MALHLDDPSPESDRRRVVTGGVIPGPWRLGGQPTVAGQHPVELAMNTSGGLPLPGMNNQANDAGTQQLFGGMFDGPTSVVRPPLAVAQNTETAPLATALPAQTPHNGYTKQDLQQLYSDQAGYTAKDREFKEIDFWVNRVAEGEGRFNTAEDLNDGGKLSVGILQWTQSSGRLGGLMQAYQNAARTAGKEDVFDQTFGGQRQAASQLATLTGKNPGTLSSSSLQSEFQSAGDIDMFRRVQVERARGDVRTDLQSINGMVPTTADGTVSGKQLAAALIMNNIGPGSPNRIFKSIDSELFSGIQNQRPDVNKQLGLSVDAALTNYRYQHADELGRMSPDERQEALDAQRNAAKQSFYGGLAGKYGDVSAQANGQTDAALLKYEQEHGLDPNNPAHKAQIDRARTDIGIQQYASLVSKGPTIGQRVNGTIQHETNDKVDAGLATYQQTHAAELARMTPAKRAQALAAQKAALGKQVAGQMAARRAELQRGAVQDNVSEHDYNEHLITSVPRHLYKGKNYTRFHRGLENRLRGSMGEIDEGHRVDLNHL